MLGIGKMRVFIAVVVFVAILSEEGSNLLFAQSSSLYRRIESSRSSVNVRPQASRNISIMQTDSNKESVVSSVSFFAVSPLPKRIFRVGDLITVIVRHSSTYKHDGKSEAEREVELKAELKNWLRIHAGHLIPAELEAGSPKAEFSLDRSFKGEGTKERKDEVVTRITCRVIDIKPNGVLVLEGGPDIIETDGEKQVITLTGTCRSEDVSEDNTILSTQLYECHFKRESYGMVRDATRRGWAYRIWDFLRPF